LSLKRVPEDQYAEYDWQAADDDILDGDGSNTEA